MKWTNNYLLPHLVPAGTVFPQDLATYTAFSMLMLFSTSGGTSLQRHGTSALARQSQQALLGFFFSPGMTMNSWHANTSFSTSVPQATISWDCAAWAVVAPASSKATATRKTKGRLTWADVMITLCSIWLIQNSERPHATI